MRTLKMLKISVPINQYERILVDEDGIRLKFSCSKHTRCMSFHLYVYFCKFPYRLLHLSLMILASRRAYDLL